MTTMKEYIIIKTKDGREIEINSNEDKFTLIRRICSDSAVMEQEYNGTFISDFEAENNTVSIDFHFDFINQDLRAL